MPHMLWCVPEKPKNLPLTGELVDSYRVTMTSAEGVDAFLGRIAERHEGDLSEIVPEPIFMPPGCQEVSISALGGSSSTQAVKIDPKVNRHNCDGGWLVVLRDQTNAPETEGPAPAREDPRTNLPDIVPLSEINCRGAQDRGRVLGEELEKLQIKDSDIVLVSWFRKSEQYCTRVGYVEKIEQDSINISGSTPETGLVADLNSSNATQSATNLLQRVWGAEISIRVADGRPFAADDIHTSGSPGSNLVTALLCGELRVLPAQVVYQPYNRTTGLDLDPNLALTDGVQRYPLAALWPELWPVFHLSMSSDQNFASVDSRREYGKLCESTKNKFRGFMSKMGAQKGKTEADQAHLCAPIALRDMLLKAQVGDDTHDQLKLLCHNILQTQGGDVGRIELAPVPMGIQDVVGLCFPGREKADWVIQQVSRPEETAQSFWQRTHHPAEKLFWMQPSGLTELPDPDDGGQEKGGAHDGDLFRLQNIPALFSNAARHAFSVSGTKGRQSTGFEDKDIIRLCHGPWLKLRVQALPSGISGDAMRQNERIATDPVAGSNQPPSFWSGATRWLNLGGFVPQDPALWSAASQLDAKAYDYNKLKKPTIETAVSVFNILMKEAKPATLAWAAGWPFDVHRLSDDEKKVLVPLADSGLSQTATFVQLLKTALDIPGGSEPKAWSRNTHLRTELLAMFRAVEGEITIDNFCTQHLKPPATFEAVLTRLKEFREAVREDADLMDQQASLAPGWISDQPAEAALDVVEQAVNKVKTARLFGSSADKSLLGYETLPDWGKSQSDSLRAIWLRAEISAIGQEGTIEDFAAHLFRREPASQISDAVAQDLAKKLSEASTAGGTTPDPVDLLVAQILVLAFPEVGDRPCAVRVAAGFAAARARTAAGTDPSEFWRRLCE